MDVVEQLHSTLDARVTSEAVAALIRTALGYRLMPAQRRVLDRAADSPRATYSSMLDDFARPVPMQHKARVLAALLDREAGPLLSAADDPWVMSGQLHMIGPMVGWDPATGQRLNREQRATYGLDLSRRRYNRLVRHLRRTRARCERMQRQVLLRQLMLVARSGLAYTVTVDEMRADVNAGCFVAYWTAQRNRRREFTLAGRDNPFDPIAQMLLDRCVARGEATDWWMIARVYPAPVVVARLADERRGELLGRWSGFMRLGAAMLRELAGGWGEQFDRETMVVRRGMDSSTWNTVAGAYNAARSAWLNCLGAAGALDLLDAACPGKVMRLMAADLVAGHRVSGGGVDPQTAVWAALPPAWEVLDGAALCTRETVEVACRAAGVDPHATGWTAPRQVGQVAAWKPTPELVHGVEVADPLWAGLLRRAGAWSGKGLRPGVLADLPAGGGQP